MKYKDYYAALGVPRDASEDAIKKAYRKLARQHHPDVSKSSDAEERFKEVGEAYATLKDSDVEMLKGVSYERIDDAGLHITIGAGDRAEKRVLDVDTVVLCTGQESVRDLVEPLTAAGKPVHVIGGADLAAELDAKRAIKQATELAARL